MTDNKVASPPKYEMSNQIKYLTTVLMFIGAVVFIIGLNREVERIWHAYLVAFFYFTSLFLGGLFFTAVNHVTNTGWNVNVRRLGESLASFGKWAFLGGLVLIAGANHVFHWTDKAHMLADPLLAVKVPYLNIKFFAVRVVLFFGLWWFFATKIIGNSLAQDESGDESLTKRNLAMSVKFILVFALSYSLFSVDTLMSLLPHWYSTIFGVYCFAGMFQSTMAFLILLAHWSRDKGLLRGFITDDHMHDLGKYMKAFTVFWAYIAFSQFMLIWYANIPEETEYFLMRSHGGWMAVSMSLLVFKFIVPFIALLPKWAKRSSTYIKAICYLILFMQAVDVYWMVYPNLNEESVLFSFWEVGVFAGFAGLFLYCVHKFLSSNNLVPVKDPRIQESLHHHVVY